MNCPRCKTAIGPLTSPDGIVICPGCGSKLMTRSAALRSQGGAKAAPAASAPAPATKPRDLPADATMPPTPAAMLALGGQWDAQPAVAPKPAPVTTQKGAASRSRAVAALPAPPAVSAESGPALPPQDVLGELLREIRAVRALQERTLELLARGGAGAPGTQTNGAQSDEPEASPIRARHQKTVVLIDDDPVTRAAAVKELEQADVPVRAFGDGNAGIAGIADEKPDVIVLELGLKGNMDGRDVISMIKATMEWVDLPIVLWTRENVPNQREARQVHGADEVVAKSAGTAALLARVITLFRRVH